MKFVRVLLTAAALLVPASAHASLIGDTVTFNTYFPNDGTLTSTQNFLVGAGIECAGCPSAGFVLPDQTLDIGANYIEFISSFTTSFGGPDAIFEFTGLDFGGGATLTGFLLTTDFANVVPSAVSFTGNSIRIDIGGSGQGTRWRLDLNQSVPEPATLSLLGLGLAGVAAARRRRNPAGR